MTELQLKIQIIEKLIHDDGGFILTIKTIENLTGATKKEIKKVIDNLKLNGMVKIDFAMDEDGMLAGRGYVLSTRATQWSIREWLEELKKIEQDKNIYITSTN